MHIYKGGKYQYKNQLINHKVVTIPQCQENLLAELLNKHFILLKYNPRLAQED